MMNSRPSPLSSNLSRRGLITLSLCTSLLFFGGSLIVLRHGPPVGDVIDSGVQNASSTLEAGMEGIEDGYRSALRVLGDPVRFLEVVTGVRPNIEAR